MKLDRLQARQKIEIWAPRYKDRVVLIAKYKVGTHNERKGPIYHGPIRGKADLPSGVARV